jgi:hypothetical protein
MRDRWHASPREPESWLEVAFGAACAFSAMVWVYALLALVTP